MEPTSRLSTGSTSSSPGEASSTSSSGSPSTAAKLPLSIRTLDGKTYKIADSKTDWTVRRLKEEFAEWQGQGWDNVGLFYKAKRLNDNELLSTYKIEPRKISEMAIPKQCRPALCMLPHTPWLTPCGIENEFEDVIKQNDGTIKMSKVELVLNSFSIPSFREWFRTNDSDYVLIKSIISPRFTVLPYITLTLEESNNDCENLSSQPIYNWKNKVYKAPRIQNLQRKDTVVWIPHEYSGYVTLGYIDFIGHLDSSSPEEGEVFAFIFIAKGIYPVANREYESLPDGGTIYRIAINELVLLTDYAKFMDTQKNLRCAGTTMRDGHTVEIIYDIGNSSMVSNGALPCINASSVGNRGSLQPSNFTHTQPEMCDTNATKVATSDPRQSSNHVKTHALALSKIAPPENITPKKTTLEKPEIPMPQMTTRNAAKAKLSQSNGVELNDNEYPHLYSSATGSRPGIANQGPDLASTMIKGKRDKNRKNASEHNGEHFGNGQVRLLGNCTVKHRGFTETAKFDNFEVGDTVIAHISEDISVGEIKMFCLIEDDFNSNPTPLVGCSFGTTVTGPRSRFTIDHTSTCKESLCSKGQLAFIPLHLLIVNDTSSQMFNVISASTSSQPTRKQSPFEKNNPFPEIDYSCESNKTGFFAASPIDSAQGVARKKFTLEGIYGCENSCYADVSLFAMFAFTNLFDYCLTSPKCGDDRESLVNNAICNILRYDIVSSLRTKGKVEMNAMLKLRSALALYNPQFCGRFMDTEDFMLTLFEKVMNVPPFYKFSNDASDYVFQIIVTFGEKDKVTAGLQTLLRRSFVENDVKLTSVPKPAFIVKLPVSDGDPLFEQVLPHLFIDMKDLLVSSDYAAAPSPTMILRAVICLKNSHYTCFARLGPTHEAQGSQWVHFDSRPGQSSPVIYMIDNLSDMLLDPCKPRTKYTADQCETLDYLLRHAYMCIYEALTTTALAETSI